VSGAHLTPNPILAGYRVSGTGRVKAYYPVTYPWCVLFQAEKPINLVRAWTDDWCWCNFLWKFIGPSKRIHRETNHCCHRTLNVGGWLAFRTYLVRMSPLFWLLPPIKVGCQVSGGHTSSRNLGFWISGGHPNFAEKVGYWVSGVPQLQGPVCNSQVFIKYLYLYFIIIFYSCQLVLRCHFAY
jgi:hypothetical protein